jgi:hypothetical protein
MRKKKEAKADAERKTVTKLRQEVKQLRKDVGYIRRMLENPAQMMMVTSGRVKPGEKVVTSAGIGIGYARWLKKEGRVDEMLDAGMSTEEIERLEEDFEREDVDE